MYLLVPYTQNPLISVGLTAVMELTVDTLTLKFARRCKIKTNDRSQIKQNSLYKLRLEKWFIESEINCDLVV